MLSDQIRLPISPDAPCGADVKYDEDFESLKSEIGKQSSVGARTDFDRLVERGSELIGRSAGARDGATTLVEDGGGIDYARVVDLATGILTSKSKDLQVVGYLCLGSLRTGGYEGLAGALETYQSLVETWWEGLFPEVRRLEARRLAVSWLAQRGSEAVAAQPPESGDGPAIERSVAACRAIDGVLREKIPENPPTLSALARTLAEHRSAVPSPAPERPTVTENAANVTAVSPSVAVLSPPPGFRVEPESPEDALRAVGRASDLLRAASPESPLGYRLLRCARWDSLDAPPPDQAGGRTLVPPPEDHAKTRFQAISALPPGADALAACEELFYDWPNPYRLGIQRIVDQSLGALGPSYAAARRALRHDLALLLQRLSGLEKLSFADGTPFADATTLDWIEREIRPLQGGGAPAPRQALPAGEPDTGLQAELAEADALCEAGNLAAGLEKLHTGQESDGRARSRFLRQLHMARLCLNGKQAGIARPLLEDLDQRIEHFGLARWEPEVCAEVWSLLQRCYQYLLQEDTQDGAELRKHGDRIFHKLCRLDVRAALSEGGRR